MQALNLSQARDIGHAYASVNSWSDAGVSLYAFASTGRVQSEEHRFAILSTIDDDAAPAALLNDQAGDLETFTGGTNGDDVAALRAFISSASLS